MDEIRGMPADALQPEHRAPNSNNTTDEHENKKKHKYQQRTFQHGSRKFRGDKRKNLGREEYLYVFKLHSVPSFQPSILSLGATSMQH